MYKILEFAWVALRIGLQRFTVLNISSSSTRPPGCTTVRQPTSIINCCHNLSSLFTSSNFEFNTQEKNRSKFFCVVDKKSLFTFRRRNHPSHLRGILWRTFLRPLERGPEHARACPSSLQTPTTAPARTSCPKNQTTLHSGSEFPVFKMVIMCLKADWWFAFQITIQLTD